MRTWSPRELELDEVTKVGSHDETAARTRRENTEDREREEGGDRVSVHALYRHALRLCEDAGRRRPPLQEQTRPQKAPCRADTLLLHFQAPECKEDISVLKATQAAEVITVPRLTRIST